MSEEPSDGTRMLLIVLAGLWAASFVLAFVAYVIIEPTGDSFLRGMNRVLAFLGWQGVAAVLSITVFGVGRRWPPGSATRRLSAVPLGIALAFVAAIGGLILWARF